MKRENGFSLIELMVSMAIVVSVVGVATVSLMQARNATEAVALEANVQENLRASMHFMVKDMMQAGEGIPQSGINLPAIGAVSAVNRPGTATIFSYGAAPVTDYTVLPAVVPGNQLGQLVYGVNPTTGALLTAGATPSDIINLFYADNSTVASDGSGNALNSFPIVQAAPSAPVCTGAIDPNGAFVTLAAGCFDMPGTPTPITAGNMIMFTNQNGAAIEYVTSVAGQTINFAAGDPAGLNGIAGATSGTVKYLQNKTAGVPNGTFPPTTVTRVWLVTYYIDAATTPTQPQLVRQVNYPGFPAGAPANPPQQIGDVIEDLQFSYDITNSTAPAGTYPLGPGDAATPAGGDTPFQIRAVNVFIAGRSEVPYTAVANPFFLRNNLSSQVCVRSLAFVPSFNTSPTAPQGAVP